MSTTVELPGGTAELKDDAELTNKEVKALRRSARIASAVATKLKGLGFEDDKPESWSVLNDIDDKEDDAIDLFQRTCVITRLKSWTLTVDDIPRELPKTVDEVDDLERPIFVPLTIAAAKVSLSDNFGADEGMNDPKADTASSDNSEQPSEESSS